MKRRLLKLVVFLLLGAIVNVAVAWGSLYWPYLYHTAPNQQIGHTLNGPGFSDWYVYTSSSSGFGKATSRWLNGIFTFKGVSDRDPAESVLPDWAGFAYPNGTYPPNIYVIRIVDARGWPFLAFWSGREVDGSSPAGATVGNSISITNGYLLPGERNMPYSHYSDARILPFAPIWTGVAINTISYAVLLWMLWLSPSVVRHHIRRTRGLCVKCGYDLRGTSGGGGGCPECGWRREAEA